jgi:adhesin transport system membrane fusion protein
MTQTLQDNAFNQDHLSNLTKTRDLKARIYAWICILLLVFLLIWSNFSRLDIVSVTIGQVVPVSQVKQIQHLEGGIVSEILILEGQIVTQDQPLIVLEPTRTQAEVDELGLRIAALKTDIARLDAEASQADTIEFDANLQQDNPELVEKAFALFEIRKERLQADINVQRELIEQRSQSINEVQAQLERSLSISELVNEQVVISEKLLSANLSNRMQHLVFLRERADINGNISVLSASLGKAQSTLGEAKAKLVSIQTGFSEQARINRAEKFGSLRELSERLVRFQDSLTRTVLRSPVDGIVKTIFVATEGGVVKSGSTILEIFPTDDRLVVEAKLAIQDIGFVSIGSEVQLQLATPDAQLFDKLNGKVTHISADTIINEKGVSFYKIKIETDQSFFQNGDDRFNLYPGMQLQSSIITGKRRVIDYFLSPILQSANTALRER